MTIIYDKEGLAEFLKMSPRSIESFMKEGMPHYKFSQAVRFRQDYVLLWLDQHYGVNTPQLNKQGEPEQPGADDQEREQFRPSPRIAHLVDATQFKQENQEE